MQKRDNENLWMFFSFIQLTNLWGDSCKDIFKQNDKFIFNQMKSAMERFQKTLESKIPKSILDESLEDGFLINDIMDKIYREENIEKRKETIDILRMVAQDKIKLVYEINETS